jgi:hypothetical protein
MEIFEVTQLHKLKKLIANYKKGYRLDEKQIKKNKDNNKIKSSSENNGIGCFVVLCIISFIIFVLYLSSFFLYMFLISLIIVIVLIFKHKKNDEQKATNHEIEK